MQEVDGSIPSSSTNLEEQNCHQPVVVDAGCA
jgi:hypothetical protein